MARPQKKDIQDRILKAAETKFFRYGFYKVSIDEIVAEAGTSKAAVYRFYKSKEDLVEDILGRLNKHINTNIETIISNSALSFQNKLERIITFTSGLFQSINKAFLNDLANHTPHLSLLYQNMRHERIKTHYKKLFSEGIRTGIVRNDIPLDFILFYYSRVMDVAVLPIYNNEINYTPKKVYQFLSKLFYEGTKV